MLSIRWMYGIPIATTLAAGLVGVLAVSCSAQERVVPVDAQPIEQEDVSPTGSYSEIRFASPNGSTLCVLRPGNNSVSCFSRNYRSAVTCYPGGECNQYELLPTDIRGTFAIGRQGQHYSDPRGFICEIQTEDRIYCSDGWRQVTYSAGHVRIS